MYSIGVAIARLLEGDVGGRADLLAEGWGAGKNAPMIAIIDGREIDGGQKAQMGAYAKVVEWAAKDENVANAQIVQMAKKGDGAVVMVTHNFDAALSTDRVITLTEGRLGSDELTEASR